MAKTTRTAGKTAKTPSSTKTRSPGGAKRQPATKPAKTATPAKATKPGKPKPAVPVSKTGLGGSGTTRPAKKRKSMDVWPVDIASMEATIAACDAVAAKPKPKSKRATPTPLPSVSEALGGLVTRPIVEGAQQSRWPAQITIGDRYRLDKGDIAGLAASINARGGLIQPIALDSHDKLIDGERRLLAWQHPTCRFRDDPIPVTVIDIDSIVAGEYDANAQRKAFTPSEAVAIKRALEPALKEEARASQSAQGGTVPQRRREQAEQGGLDLGPAASDEAGRAAARVAKIVGKDRRTVEKAQAVVEAAERDPEKYGKLKEDMDRTGKVDGPFKRLKVMQQTEAIRSAPPPLPGNGPYKVVVIDFPVAGDPDKDQEQLDAAGRSFRGYPEMSLATCMAFAADNIRPLLADDVAVWLWVTNFHLVQGWYDRIVESLGLAGCGRTMLTWDKVAIGRGAVLRERTEHCILLTRGDVVIDVFGKDPPTTLIAEARRENSRKPDRFYRLVERVTPAPRYASIFSRGGEGELWDGHGDELGKFPGAGEAAGPAAPETEADRIGRALAAVAAGGVVEDAEIRGELQKQKLIRGKVPKLTSAGGSRLDAWRQVVADRELMASLPDDIGALTEDYRATLARRHEAILGSEFQHIEGTSISGKRSEIVARASRRLKLLQQKANAGELQGMGFDDSPAEELRRAAAAPIGEVPIWGSRGMFRLEVDGMACLVRVDDHGWFEVFACSDAPFISETGFRSFPFGIEEAFGLTVDSCAARLIAEEIANPAEGASGRRKARKNVMPIPERHYRLPPSWDLADRPMRVGDPPIPIDDDASDDETPAAAAADEDWGWGLTPASQADDGDDETPEAIEGELPAGDDPGPIPDDLLRDETGHAPFMDAASDQAAE